MSHPIRESDILFPHQSNNPSLSNTLSTLRRSTLSLHNRLSSITSDSLFVTLVASAYDLPLIANERCGSWYIPSLQKAGSVYFKSTDGHMGQWSFSLRRLNLQLLDVVTESGGAVVVDSTRRGKRMPDALSKTIPVWCAVVNRAVFEVAKEGEEEKRTLHVPPNVVSESEKVQVEARIGGFVKQFMEICEPHLPILRAKLKKPLRPIWITQASSLPSAPPSFPDFHPVVLCTASHRVHGAEISENGYIQGAADDHEAWANGLTPQLFWKHKDLLMNTPEDEAPSVIKKLITEEESGIATASLIKPTATLYISSSEGVDIAGFNVIIACTPTPLSSSDLKSNGVKHHLHLKCQTGKLGSRNLRTQLPQLSEFLVSLPSMSSIKVLVCCPTGKDLSVGTALAILCLLADEQGSMGSMLRTQSISKDFIKQRLSWITTSNPALNPSRATLQSVNAFLFDTQASTPISCSKTSAPGNPFLEPTIAIRASTPPHTDKQVVSTCSSPSHPQKPTSDPPTPEQIFASLGNSSRPWTFTRTLTSALPTHPSGTVIGTATFTPCALNSDSAPTLLYAEEGNFTLANGLNFSVKRRYVYRLEHSRGNDMAVGEDEPSSAPDAEGIAAPALAARAPQKHIAIYFFDDEALPRSTVSKGVGDKGQGIGGLFVEMDALSAGVGGREPQTWAARNKATHLCVEDLYTASWEFSRDMVGRAGEGGDAESDVNGESKDGLAWWEVRYDVKGPKKDYMSCTRYARS